MKQSLYTSTGKIPKNQKTALDYLKDAEECARKTKHEPTYLMESPKRELTRLLKTNK